MSDIDIKADPGASLLPVTTGCHVEIELRTQEGAERLAFDIVPDKQADFSAGFLGEGTSLARTVAGKTAGSLVPYQEGDILAVHILRVAPSASLPPPDTAIRREEKMRQAVSESERTNAMIFASSFSGKWGDYDPDGLKEGW
jgi:hypothetical protein